MDHEPRFPAGEGAPLWLLVTGVLFGISLMLFGIVGFLIGIL